MIILKKIQVTMNTFVPPFFNNFCFSLNRKKRVVMRFMRNKLNLFTLQLPIFIYWCKYRHCQNETREIDCPCCPVVQRWTQYLSLKLKSWSAREASHHPAFMGDCPTFSHMCYPYLPSRWVFLLVPGVAERNKDAGRI